MKTDFWHHSRTLLASGLYRYEPLAVTPPLVSLLPLSLPLAPLALLIQLALGYRQKLPREALEPLVRRGIVPAVRRGACPV
jgi:hypothetical protein